jgi:CRP-like cAMP-binding protein
MLNNPALYEKYGKNYPANTIIFCEFEPGNDFYLIQKGKVRISKVVGETEKTLDVLKDGDIFGEMAILEEQPRSATASTVDEVELLHFNRENFLVLMQGNPALALKLLSIFAKRIYDAKRRLMVLLLDDLNSKVADVFLMLAEHENPNLDNKRQIILHVQPQDIANWCAEPVAKVEDVINHYNKQGRLEIYADRIVLNNIQDFIRIVKIKRKSMS